MIRTRRAAGLALVAVLALLATACGGDDESASDGLRTTTTGDDEERETTSTTEEEEEETTTTTEEEEEEEEEETTTTTEEEETVTTTGGGDDFRSGGFSDQVEDITGEQIESESADTFSEFEVVTDDEGAIELEVPTEWSERNGTALDYLQTGEFSPSIVAAPDITAFSETFSAPGVQVALLQGADPADSDGVLSLYMDAIGANTACPTQLFREDYDDGIYRGRFEIRSECDGTEAVFAGIVAVPSDGSFVAFVAAQLVDDADFEALDKIVETFIVT